MNDKDYLKLTVEQARKSIVYACRKTPEMVKKYYYEGFTDNKVLNDNNNKKIETVFIPDYEQEMLELVKNWEEKQTVASEENKFE